MNWKNKVVVITGGANGIGKYLVTEFAKLGAFVATIDREPINITGVYSFVGDLAVENDLQKFSGTVLEKFGSIDFLINNACLTKQGLLSDCSYEDFNYVLKVGVTAPYILAKLFAPHFTAQGAIVNITSTRAYQSEADSESYTAAKGGLTALTHSLAISLAGKVRVNSIAPGWIDTTDNIFSPEDNAQHPVGRIGQPLDIFQAVLFLCSTNSSFITGTNITVDGGMSKLMIYHESGGWKYQ